VPEAFYPLSWALSGVLAVGTAVVVLTWLSGRRDRAFWAMVAVPWLFGLLLVRPTWPLVASYSQDPFRRLAVLARQHVPEGRSLVVPRMTWSSIVYYSRRHVYFTHTLAYHRVVEEEGRPWPIDPEEFRQYEREEIARAFGSGRAAAVLVQDNAWDRVEGLGPWRVVGRDGPFSLLIPEERRRAQTPPAPDGSHGAASDEGPTAR
jgi:hypothetical protein